MKPACALLFLLLPLFVAHTSAENPFRARPTAPPSDTGATHSSAQPRSAGVRSRLAARAPFMNKVIRIQHRLIGQLGKGLRTVQDHGMLSATGIGFLFLCALYGFIHGMGPGHAKIVAFTHSALYRPSTPALWSGAVVFSCIHAGMAVGLFLLAGGLRGTMHSSVASGHATPLLMRTSGILIAAAGILTILSPLLERKKGEQRKKVEGVWAHPAGVMGAAGLVPCPGALLILGFSAAAGVVPLGLIAVGSVSAGMALTVGLSATLGKGVVCLGALRPKLPGLHRLIPAIRTTGGLILMAAGLLLLQQ